MFIRRTKVRLEVSIEERGNKKHGRGNKKHKVGFGMTETCKWFIMAGAQGSVERLGGSRSLRGLL